MQTPLVYLHVYRVLDTLTLMRVATKFATFAAPAVGNISTNLTGSGYYTE